MKRGNAIGLKALGTVLAVTIIMPCMAWAGNTVEDAEAHHSADFRVDHKIDLIELLRVIQLFNTGEFHCQAGTEDGYALGPGSHDCEPHDSDFSGTPNWRISLTELLRVIQFFNVCGYKDDAGSEDGYGPVFCVNPEGEGEATNEGDGEAATEGDGEATNEGDGEAANEGEGEAATEGEGEAEALKYARVVIGEAKGAPGTVVPVEFRLEVLNMAPASMQFDVFFNSSRLMYYGNLVGPSVTDAGKQLSVSTVNFGQMRVTVSGDDDSVGMTSGVIVVLGFTLSSVTDFDEVYSIFGQNLAAVDALTGQSMEVSVLAGSITIYSADPVAPVANFTATPKKGLPGTEVTFTDTSRMGNGTNRTWQWTFGDGKTSTERNPKHVYEETGVYDVALTVTTSAGVNTKTEVGLIEIVEGVRIFVDKNAVVVEGEKEQDGLSWETAFATIQEGIDAAYTAGGGEIWVAANTYDEERANATGTLMMREVVRLYGGFTGVETALGQRDWTINQTIIDGSVARAGEPAYHVLAGASNALLDGFTITGGLAPVVGASTSSQQGGGMYNAGVSMTITNCLFTQNAAQGAGAAMYNAGGTLHISNCQFIDNVVEYLGNPDSYTYGGAIYSADTQLTISGCEFTNNRLSAAASWTGTAANVAAYAYGAGVYGYNCNMTIEDTLFLQNKGEAEATGHGTVGGAVYGAYAQAFGGGLYGKFCTATISRCVFRDNQTSTNSHSGFTKGSGGGVCQIKGSMVMTNSVVYSNNSSDFGDSPERSAGVHVDSTDKTVITNCVIVGNLSDSNDLNHGGGLFVWYSEPVVTNTIFWGNSGGGIYTVESEPAITYCDIQNNTFEGIGNTDANPQFVLLSGGNFRLLAGSPCIDSGRDTSGAEFGSVTEDIEGSARGFDGNTVVNADGSNYDMGVYEYIR